MGRIDPDGATTKNLTERETRRCQESIEAVSRRQAFATVAGGISLIAAPAIVRAQVPLTVKFVQQRGLLYLPVDMMVTAASCRRKLTKLGLGKVEAHRETP